MTATTYEYHNAAQQLADAMKQGTEREPTAEAGKRPSIWKGLYQGLTEIAKEAGSLAYQAGSGIVSIGKDAIGTLEEVARTEESLGLGEKIKAGKNRLYKTVVDRVEIQDRPVSPAPIAAGLGFKERVKAETARAYRAAVNEIGRVKIKPKSEKQRKPLYQKFKKEDLEAQGVSTEDRKFNEEGYTSMKFTEQNFRDGGFTDDQIQTLYDEQAGKVEERAEGIRRARVTNQIRDKYAEEVVTNPGLFEGVHNYQEQRKAKKKAKKEEQAQQWAVDFGVAMQMFQLRLQLEAMQTSKAREAWEKTWNEKLWETNMKESHARTQAYQNDTWKNFRHEATGN